MKKSKEVVNAPLIKKMLKEGKWRQCEICEQILGINRGTFSSSLSRPPHILPSDVIDKLAALFKVDRRILLANEEPVNSVEDKNEPKTIDLQITDRMALYNFLTSIEAAITNFRQDLLASEKEVS